MDFVPLEAAYTAFDSDDDIEVAIGVAHRALLRAANMPAGREQRRTLSEATNKLCAALEHNILDDPDFSLNRSTPRARARNASDTRARPRNAPDTRASSSKRARIRKVVIESDSDEEENSTSDAESAMNEAAPTRRSTRLAENVLKEAEAPSPPEEAPVAEEVTPTPVPDANGKDCDSSTSAVSDADAELVLPVVRPKPQVPPLPLVSDRASQTPAITAEDEDTEEELERSRRAHAPRPRPVLDLDSSGDNSNGVDAYTRAGQETVIASPFRRPDAMQAVPILPNAVQMGAIAPPHLRSHLSNGAGHSQSLPRANQRSDGVSIEAEISAARVSLSMAQEQQNNWIRSLNVEQERRMRAARLFAQQRNLVDGQRTTGVPYSLPNTVHATRHSESVTPMVPRSSGVMIQNSPMSPAVQNGMQQLPRAPIVTNTNPFGANIPISVSSNPPSMPHQKSVPTRPPANGGFRSAANSNALQLQIIQENLELEKQNQKMAELFAQQDFASQFQRQPGAASQQAQLNEQRRQFQLREAARQQQLLNEQKRQQKHLEEQVRLERIRLLREAQEKKQLDLQMKELENQQKQIQERKKIILQQQIELQERHLREQQLQQQRIREQQRSRELIQQQQAHHVQELQLQQQIQVQRQQQLLRQQQMQQQLRNQQQFAQQQFAQQQNVMQKRILQERQQDLRAQQQLAQQQQILQQRIQQPHVSQSHQQNPSQLQHQVVGQQQAHGQFVRHQQPGQKLHQTQKSEITAPAPRVALGRGNLSSAASNISNQVASLSSALFSLNGTPGKGNLPRKQSITPNLLSFPNSSTPLAKQHQSNRVEPSAVRRSEIPALQVSSATVEGNVQAGFETVPKKGSLGGSAPLIQNGRSLSNMQNNGAVQVTRGSSVQAQRMSCDNTAPRRSVARGGPPQMTRHSEETPGKGVPLVRSSVIDKTEIEIAPPPRLRLSKRALLEWDIENLKGKQGKKEVSGLKRKKM